MERAQTGAVVGERIGDELELPGVPLRRAPPGLGPAYFRTGGLDGLRRRVESGALTPDFGPGRLDERTGAVLVGARRPLIALNVNLAAARAAREIASVVRERTVAFRACAPRLRAAAGSGLVQVEHERRGLGGCRPARADQDDRARSGNPRGRSGRRRAGRPHARRSRCRCRGSRPANRRVRRFPRSWSFGCSKKGARRSPIRGRKEAAFGRRGVAHVCARAR